MISCPTRKRDGLILICLDQRLRLIDAIMDDLKKLIREVPDFPKPGINFYDITTLLKHPEGLRKTVDALAAEFEGTKIDAVSALKRAASSLHRRWPITWGRALYPCGNPRSCL